MITPQGLPEDAQERGYRFKGHADFVVQDLVIRPHTIRYRLEQWQSPEEMLKGQLPVSVEDQALVIVPARTLAPGERASGPLAGGTPALPGVAGTMTEAEDHYGATLKIYLLYPYHHQL